MFFEILSEILMGWIFVALFQFGLWLYADHVKNVTIVDVGWAFSLAMLSTYYVVLNERAVTYSRYFILIVPLIWGLRLSWHLFEDRILNSSVEDIRYQELRKSWKSQASWKFLILFQVQAIISSLMSISYLSSLHSTPHIIQVALAAILGIGSIIGEAISDHQLKVFKNIPSNKGKICRSGLWSISRHPNYFFEWLHWTSYIVLSTSMSTFMASLIAPAILIFLLFKISGIPTIEVRALAKKGEAFKKYQNEVPVFFPTKLFSRK